MHKKNMTTDYTTFAQRLDTAHDWPCEYTFKFIVPHQEAIRVQEIFGPEASVRKVASRTGKYISVTSEVIMTSAEQVIAIYKQAETIEGIVML